MLAVRRNFKFAGMRKEQDFIIYPTKIGQSIVILQSDSRIARIDVTTGKGLLSKACPRGAYFHHLDKFLGAYDIELTQEQIDLILTMQVKMSKGTNPDGSMTIGAKVVYA